MKRALRVAVVAFMLFGMVVTASASPAAAGYCSGVDVSGDNIDVAHTGGNVVIDNDGHPHGSHYHHGHYYDGDLIDLL